MWDSFICSSSALHRVLGAAECLGLGLGLAVLVVAFNRHTREQLVSGNRAELQVVVALGVVSTTVALTVKALMRGGIDGIAVAVMAGELVLAATYYFAARFTVAVQAGQPVWAGPTAGSSPAWDRWSAQARVFCHSMDTTRLGMVIRRALAVVAAAWFTTVAIRFFSDSDPQGCLLTGEPFGALVDALRHVTSRF
jgi:hypothetical protein